VGSTPAAGSHASPPRWLSLGRRTGVQRCPANSACSVRYRGCPRLGGTTSTTCPGSPTAGGTAFRARTVCVRIALRVRNSTWCRSSIGQSAGPSSRRQRVRFPSAPHAHVGELADLVRLRTAKPSTGDTPGEFESRTLRHPVEAEEVSGASLITRRQKVQLLPTGLMPTWSNGQDTGLRNLGSRFDSSRGCVPGCGAAWSARRVRDAEAAGSSPASLTIWRSQPTW
jgi:hypothetical protein